MKPIQYYTQAITKIFDVVIGKKERTNYIALYRSVAKLTTRAIKRMSASGKELTSDNLSSQKYKSLLKEEFAIIEELIHLRHEGNKFIESCLTEVAHELKSSTKGTEADLRFFCAAILGAKEHISILPSILKITCSEGSSGDNHQEIQLLIAIAIETNKWINSEKINGNIQPKEGEVDLEKEISKYMKAIKIDPSFPRLIPDQLQLRSHLLNIAKSKLLHTIPRKAIENEVNENALRSIKYCDMFSGYKYDKRQTGGQRSILLDHYINEMNISRILISYPKCGRTWLRTILSEINKKTHFKFTHLMANPYFWTSKPSQFVFPSYGGDLAVFLHRDPRDVLVSQFYNVHLRDIPHKESLEDSNPIKFVLTDFVKSTSPPPKKMEDFIFCPHWGFNRLATFNVGVLKNCDIGHIWSYEKMMLYPKSSISELCIFLEINARNAAIYQSILRNNFRSMQSRELSQGHANSSRIGKLYENHDLSNVNARKVRKGQVGGWSEEIDQSCHKKLITMTKNYYLNLLDACPSSLLRQLHIPSDISRVIGRKF